MMGWYMMSENHSPKASGFFRFLRAGDNQIDEVSLEK